MSYFLSIDVGITNGLALFTMNGKLIHTWAVYVDDLEHFLSGSAVPLSLSRVVAERPIVYRGPLGEQMARALGIVDRFFDDVYWVEASWWKSHPLAGIRDTGVSIHERDAIALGRVFYRRELQG